MLMLDGPSIIDVHDEKVLITHGDELCTDDASYQKFRKHARSPTWRALFLSMPLAMRRWFAGQIRNSSKTITALKPEDITDINQDAVEETMLDQRVKILLHGHTHRPGIHQFNLRGQDAMRIVLGDWYKHGSVLEWGPSGPQLRTLPLS